MVEDLNTKLLERIQQAGRGGLEFGAFQTPPSLPFGSLYVSGKLPTYPSPKPTLTLTSH